MASFSAELRVDGQRYPLTECTFGVHQGTGPRGRASTKVRCEPVQFTLDVPRDALLPAWAADPHKRLAADIVFRDASSGSALETLSLKGTYCIYYGEVFIKGDARSGAFQAQVVLTDPEGFTLQAGGPARWTSLCPWRGSTAARWRWPPRQSRQLGLVMPQGLTIQWTLGVWLYGKVI